MPRHASWLLTLPLAALPFVTGCGPKKTSEFTTKPSETQANALRPADFNFAIQDIKANRGAEAETRMKAWLDQDDNVLSPDRPEAFYLLGQAQFIQGKYKEAKVSHDIAEDRAKDRTVKALAQFARAECNYELEKYSLAIDQYMWIEQFYRDVMAVPQDEVLYKLGMSNKKLGFTDTADYWFHRVVELYAGSKLADEAKRQHSKLGAGENGDPKYYSLEVATFTKEDKANAEADVYRQKGYANVRVEPYTKMGNQYYGVMLGRYFNKMDAKRAQEDAELAGMSASIRPGWYAWPK
ncbi:MAG: SPOR domain-containing protein [Planctomycetota bacterium]|nr:SPOR domain-containing protein [Planctomycetota bacterium]